QFRLLPLPLRVAPPGDPRAGAEMKSALPPLVGPDPDRQRGAPSIGVDPADGAAVDPAWDRLELLDHAQRARLRRAAHRGRWERRGEQVGPRGGGGNPRRYRRG